MRCLFRLVPTLSKALLQQGSVHVIAVHKDNISHENGAFMDRYFSGTHVACFSQSSLLEHLQLLCDTPLYYVIPLACCRLCESIVALEAS